MGARFVDEAARLGSTLVIDARERAVGHWDRERLEQVVSNLISNAVKYGDGKPIDVTVRAEGGHARLVVQDRGLGIAARDHDRIFGRFERAASSGNFGGIGLGLWIVKQIVGVFGGAVQRRERARRRLGLHRRAPATRRSLERAARSASAHARGDGAEGGGAQQHLHRRARRPDVAERRPRADQRAPSPSPKRWA